MCGINGAILTSGEVSRRFLEKSIAKLGHRGPDASGIWISNDKKIGFAQRRLSIVDLKERSNQPLVIDNGQIVINFNGEIYNYRELREELEKNGKYMFKTTSDTEVLGYAYKEWGKKLFDRIEGMFAFAIYDSEKRETLIARDFVGQKPLVYIEDKTGFYFASEIPALLEMAKTFAPNIHKRIDMEALALFLTENYSHIPAPFTAFKDIRKLEPSTYFVIRHGKVIEKKRYFRLKKKNEPMNKSEDTFIVDIISDMKPSDVTYSLFLSGGNDSAVVGLGLRKDNKDRVDAYTLRVGNNDEDYSRSKYVAKELGFTHHIIGFDKSGFLGSVDGQIKNYGEPYYHMTSVYADYILREVRKRHKVIFTGAGGDEVYYGYDNLLFIGVDILLKLKKVIPGALLKAVLPKKYHFIIESDLSDIKEKYYLQSFNSIKGLFNDKNLSIKSYARHLNKAMFDLVEIGNYVDLSYMFGLFVENSHSLTIQSDLVGMKNSIEVRCPFLERRIIERGYGLGLFRKISFLRPREGKLIIKKALEKSLSRKFAYSRKIGFGVEMQRYDELISLNYKKIHAQFTQLSKRGLFDKDELFKLIPQKTENKKILPVQFMLIMKLYAIEAWLSRFSS